MTCRRIVTTDPVKAARNNFTKSLCSLTKLATRNANIDKTKTVAKESIANPLPHRDTATFLEERALIKTNNTQALRARSALCFGNLKLPSKNCATSQKENAKNTPTYNSAPFTALSPLTVDGKKNSGKRPQTPIIIVNEILLNLVINF